MSMGFHFKVNSKNDFFCKNKMKTKHCMLDKKIGATTFSITTLSITTFSINGLFRTLSIIAFSINDTQRNSTSRIIE